MIIKRKMAKRPRLTAVDKIWDREDIISCKCGDVTYTHAHCPCEYCDGRAVSRSTEYRHWQIAQSQWGLFSENCGGDPEDHESDEDGENGDGTGDHEDGDGTGDHEDGDSTGDHEDDDDNAGGHNNSDGSSSGSIDDDNTDGDDENAPHGPEVNVSNDVIGAITQAMTITEEVSGSQQNFLSILNYGKELYCKGKENKDEIESQWPNSWQKALRLLETKGYRDPKDVFICL